MKIRLNLATSPLENHGRFLLGALLVGGVALTLFVVLSIMAVRNWRDSSDFRSEMAQLQNELADFRKQRRDLEDFFNSPGPRRVTDRASFLNGLIRQRSFPWTRIFVALEGELPPGVRVVSIAPSMEKEGVQVKLVFGARDDENKIRFLKILEDSPEFVRVQIISENRPQQGEDRLLVEVAAWYKSAEPESETPVEAKVAASGAGGAN